MNSVKGEGKRMRITRKLVGVMASTLLAATAVVGIGTVVGASPAEAAACSYSNLTSTQVKNVNCRAGAYAYLQGSTWYQSGDWVAKGYYSYNWYLICYSHAGMLAVN
jgi:hypothetical protein